MMKIYKAMMRLPLFLLLVAATGCDYNDIPVNDGDIVLEILDDDGNAIEGITQTFAFGANHSYTVRSSNINYVKITKPKGWLCELVPSSRHFSITAPQFSDLNSDASGEVIIDIAHQTGRTLQVKIPVATIENDILLTIDPDEIAGTQVFAFGRRKEYAFMSQNVASVDLAVPKGWKAEADLKKNVMIVSAPAEGSEYEKTGKLVVTPRSLRGTAGTATTIALELSTELPVIIFDKVAYNCEFGKSTEIPFTAKNVADAEISQLPAGWNADLRLAENKLVVTAPALDTDTSFAALDALTLRLTSKSGLEADITVNLGLGLSTLEHMKALSTALKGGLVTVGKVKSGAVALMNDIDLSSVNEPILLGDTDEAHAVAFPFDGQNHTLTYHITAAENLASNSMLGLIGHLAPTASVSNLTINATIVTTQKTKSICGALAAVNKGATVRNVKANVTFSCKADISGKYDAASVWGGLIGQSETAVYSDILVTGSTELTYMWRFGGIVGELTPYSEGSFSKCENQMNIDMPFFMTASNCEYGGITAGNSLSNWTYTDLTNRGDITWSFLNAQKDNESYIYALGGILGRGYGTLVNCRNYGKLEGNDRYQSRRIGGVVGGSGDNNDKQYSLRMDNCHNYGEISTSSTMTGGLIGMAEKGEDNLIQNCTNEGNVMTAKNGKDANTIAGFMGAAYGKNTLVNCVNRGTVSGNPRYRAAGLIGNIPGGGTVTITNCRNEGAMNFKDTNSGKLFPLVAGLIILEKENSKAVIRTSANTGAITLTTASEYVIQPVYIFQPPYDGKPDAQDTVDCDQITKDESAATKITVIKE